MPANRRARWRMPCREAVSVHGRDPGPGLRDRDERSARPDRTGIEDRTGLRGVQSAVTSYRDRVCYSRNPSGTRPQPLSRSGGCATVAADARAAGCNRSTASAWPPRRRRHPRARHRGREPEPAAHRRPAARCRHRPAVTGVRRLRRQADRRGARGRSLPGASISRSPGGCAGGRPAASAPGKVGLAAFEFLDRHRGAHRRGLDPSSAPRSTWSRARLRSGPLDPGGIEPLEATLEQFRAALSRGNHTLEAGAHRSAALSGIGNSVLGRDPPPRAALAAHAHLASLPTSEIARLPPATRVDAERSGPTACARRSATASPRR